MLVLTVVIGGVIDVPLVGRGWCSRRDPGDAGALRGRRG
jgi:hypothetical protein